MLGRGSSSDLFLEVEYGSRLLHSFTMQREKQQAIIKKYKMLTSHFDDDERSVTRASAQIGWQL